jgi:hypothetical protein
MGTPRSAMRIRFASISLAKKSINLADRSLFLEAESMEIYIEALKYKPYGALFPSTVGHIFIWSGRPAPP